MNFELNLLSTNSFIYPEGRGVRKPLNFVMLENFEKREKQYSCLFFLEKNLKIPQKRLQNISS